MPRKKPDGLDAEEREEVSSFTDHKARTAMIVAIISAAGAALALIVVPITQSYINISRPGAKPNAEEVMKALKEESERQSKDIRQTHDDLLELRSWVKGYLTAQGIKINDPPNSDLPPTPTVEIKPKPVHPRRTLLAPAPTVETPLPAPKPLGAAKEIPYPIAPEAP